MLKVPSPWAVLFPRFLRVSLGGTGKVRTFRGGPGLLRVPAKRVGYFVSGPSTRHFVDGLVPEEIYPGIPRPRRRPAAPRLLELPAPPRRLLLPPPAPTDPTAVPTRCLLLPAPPQRLLLPLPILYHSMWLVSWGRSPGKEGGWVEDETPQIRRLDYVDMFGFMGHRKIYFPERGQIKYEGPKVTNIFNLHRAGESIPLEPYKLYSVRGPVTLGFPAATGVYFARGFEAYLGEAYLFYEESFFDGSKLPKPQPSKRLQEPRRDSLEVASRRRTLSRRFESQRLPLVNSAGGVH